MLASAALVVLLPRWAAACPSCARAAERGGDSPWIVGAMLLVPLVTAAAAALALRRYVKRNTP